MIIDLEAETNAPAPPQLDLFDQFSGLDPSG